MTDDTLLAAEARRHLEALCVTIPSRPVGSPGNRAATDYVARHLRSIGLPVDTPAFDCIHWVDGGATLTAGGVTFPVHTGPFSLPVECRGTLRVARTREDLESSDLAGAVLLVAGPLAAEQLMPRNFVFYNPEHHREYYRLYDACGARTIVAATGCNPAVAGGLCPFPLFEDGDFLIPNAYMSESDGLVLARHEGGDIDCSIRSDRQPSTGCNVIAGAGPRQGPKTVVTAHIDTKPDTPGAIDNATGVVVLLLLAGLLAREAPAGRVELAILNGEDYYAVPGQMRYLADPDNGPASISMVVNIDGAGYAGRPTAYSLYQCSEERSRALRGLFGGDTDFVEGESWVQGDHSMFVMQGIPALALTSSGAMDDLWRTVAHTRADRADIVDAALLARCARMIHRMLR